MPAIERQVMCVTCKIPLNVAESPQSQRERAYIRGLIAEGKTEAQIKSALVGQYGTLGAGLAERQRLRPGCVSRARRRRARADRTARAAAAELAPPCTRPGRDQRRLRPSSARATRHAWTRTSSASTDKPGSSPPASCRHSGDGRRDASRYISAGASTPSSSSERAIVCREATHSARRWDSSAGDSAPSTRQSR